MTEKQNEYIDIVTMKIKDINVATYNPRDISEEELAGLRESIKKFGFVEPLVFNLTTSTLVGGHQRLKAAELEGYTEVPVSLVRLSLAEEKALNVALNSHTISGKFNNDILRPLLAEIKLELPDVFSSLNFAAFDLPDLKIEVLPPVGEDDGGGELPVQPKTRRGDIWILGEHRVMCGDSTDLNDVEKLMNHQKADMVFTDPPYGVSYTGGHNKKQRKGIENDTLEGDDLTGLFENALSNAEIISKDSSAFYIWYAGGKSVETYKSFDNLNLQVRAVICWYKIKSGLGAFMSQYIPNYEPCIYAFKKGCSPKWRGPTDEKTVWELKKESRNDYHPTQKPIELSERAIGNSSDQGDIIYDCFLGSGATLVGAEKTGRKCYGLEIDAKYVDVILNRWQKLTGKDAILEETGETYANTARY